MLTAGPEVEAQSLPDALKIPTLRFNTSSARDCQLSEGARHSVLAYVDTAEKLLAQAVEGYDKAVFAAGDILCVWHQISDELYMCTCSLTMHLA